jgi:hypothetical protein
MSSKVGTTFRRRIETTTDAHDDDDDRVGHRALDLALQLLGLLHVLGEPVEDRVENAADLAGGDEVLEQLVERVGEALERVGEGRARLHRVLDGGELLPEGGVGRLLALDLETLHERQPRVDHRGELPREDDQVLRRNLGLEEARHRDLDGARLRWSLLDLFGCRHGDALGRPA